MRTIGIQTPFGRALSFVELKGVEALSNLYEYRLVLTSKDPNLAATDIIGQTSPSGNSTCAEASRSKSSSSKQTQKTQHRRFFYCRQIFTQACYPSTSCGAYNDGRLMMAV